MAQASSAATLKKGATAITDVLSITGPGPSRAPIDITNLVATSKAFLVDIPDGGEVTFELQYDPDDATHSTLWTDFLAGTADTYNLLVVGTATKTWTFSAYVVRLSGPKAAVGGKVTMDVTLKVTGAVSVT